jgi:Asp-tRNA(Asn)/Glu-tRNA(Gln) amidotransferase A subunit family amidase
MPPHDMTQSASLQTRSAHWPGMIPSVVDDPAVSLPCGLDAVGMPLAIQLIARPGEDERLLRVASVFGRERSSVGVSKYRQSAI